MHRANRTLLPKASRPSMGTASTLARAVASSIPSRPGRTPCPFFGKQGSPEMPPPRPKPVPPDQATCNMLK